MITQINPFWFQRNWKNIALVLAIGVILLMHQCREEPSIAKEYKVNAEKKLQIARNLIKDKDNIIKNYDATISELNHRNNATESQLSKLKQSQSIKLAKIKHYNTNDIAKYYIDLYNVPNGVKTVLGAVELKDTVSRLVINDLIVGQGAKFENRLLNGKLAIANDKFNLANKTIDTLKISINSISEAYESANESNNKVITSIEKQVKSERRKKNIWKITAFGVLAGAVYLSAK